MTKITLKGNAINTSGELPNVGSLAKDFKLIATDLSTKTLNDFKGKNLVLNVFPSIDTGTCAASVRNFNKSAANLNNTSVLCISRDLPFAQNRFCGAEGIENVITLSDFVNGSFGNDYNLTITSGPLSNLHSRCIIALDENHNIIYTEQVLEITTEPNYEKAISAIS